jgi:hypothetical protein
MRAQGNIPTLLLRDRAARKKLCRKINRDTQCKTKRGCETCPVTIFARVEMEVNNKHLTIGEAYLISKRREKENE